MVRGMKVRRINLYVHYDSVTNHVMTRAINLTSEDFQDRFFPQNMILAEAPPDFGRYDVQTDFKILRGQTEVQSYLETAHKEGLRLSNWMDFESIDSMHQLTPNEIAELLYFFHANKSLKSAFFYKLQNNYVYLTLPNGLNKMYYRYVTHFYPRFQRVMQEQTYQLINESHSLFFMKKQAVAPLSETVTERIAPIFSAGLKVNFAQAYQKGTQWFIPINIIEDQLTLLRQDQRPVDHLGFFIYDTNRENWQVDIKLKDEK